MLGLVTAILALLAESPLPGPPPSAPVTETDVVQAARDRFERMTVPVTIGGQAFRFLVDTGSPSSVVSHATMTRLALVPKGRRRVVGLAGTHMAETVRIEEVRFGRRRLRGIVAPVLAAENIGADGIIGIDGLQGERVLLDFTRDRIAIDHDRSERGESGESFEIVVTARRRGRQLILTDIRVDGVQAAAIFDTGADASVGNLALMQALTRRRGPVKTAELLDATGQTAVATIGVAREVAIDRLRFAQVPIAYVDAPAFHAVGLGNRPAIMLGMRELRLFKRVAIDFKRRKVLFDLPPGLR